MREYSSGMLACTLLYQGPLELFHPCIFFPTRYSGIWKSHWLKPLVQSRLKPCMYFKGMGHWDGEQRWAVGATTSLSCFKISTGWAVDEGLPHALFLWDNFFWSQLHYSSNSASCAYVNCSTKPQHKEIHLWVDAAAFTGISEKQQLVQEMEIGYFIVIILCHLLVFRSKCEQWQGPGLPSACRCQELQRGTGDAADWLWSRHLGEECWKQEADGAGATKQPCGTTLPAERRCPLLFVSFVHLGFVREKAQKLLQKTVLFHATSALKVRITELISIHWHMDTMFSSVRI